MELKRGSRLLFHNDKHLKNYDQTKVYILGENI